MIKAALKEIMGDGWDLPEVQSYLDAIGLYMLNEEQLAGLAAMLAKQLLLIEDRHIVSRLSSATYVLATPPEVSCNCTYGCQVCYRNS